MSIKIAGLRTGSLARTALYVQVRHASTKRTGTAQDVDKMLGEQKKQARMSPGMDPTQQPLALFQPIVEPSLSISRFASAGFGPTVSYFYNRGLRWWQTRGALKMVERLDRDREGMTRMERFLDFFPRQYHQYRAKALIEHAFTQYIAFNQAQASGDLALLRSAAQGTAYEIARKRIAERPAGDSLDWQLLRVVHKPKLRSIVVGQITASVYASQAIVAFDTEQTLTYKPKGRIAQVRSSRVKEFYALQRLMPGFGNAWKLRDQLHETDPFAELKAKRLEASKVKAIK